MFVPSVPLVPRIDMNLYAAMSSRATATGGVAVPGQDDDPHKHGPVSTTMRNLKEERIAQMLREEVHRSDAGGIFRGIATLDGTARYVFDTQDTSSMSARVKPTRKGEADADAGLPPIAVPNSAREKRMADRLLHFEASKSGKPISKMKVKPPVRLASLTHTPRRHARKYREA